MQDSMPSGTGGMVALIGCNDEVVKNTLTSAKKHGKIFIANDPVDEINNALSQVKSSEANLRKVQSQMERTESLFSQNLISQFSKVFFADLEANGPQNSLCIKFCSGFIRLDRSHCHTCLYEFQRRFCQGCPRSQNILLSITCLIVLLVYFTYLQIH